MNFHKAVLNLFCYELLWPVQKKAPITAAVLTAVVFRVVVLVVVVLKVVVLMVMVLTVVVLMARWQLDKQHGQFRVLKIRFLRISGPYFLAFNVYSLVNWRFC